MPHGSPMGDARMGDTEMGEGAGSPPAPAPPSVIFHACERQLYFTASERTMEFHA